MEILPSSLIIIFMKTKTYCVHVYERPREYENVKAKTSADAQAKIIDREWGGDWDDISSVEVMIQCDDCGTDNDTSNTKCEECGARL
jgi:hypothetical protein